MNKSSWGMCNLIVPIDAMNENGESVLQNIWYSQKKNSNATRYQEGCFFKTKNFWSQSRWGKMCDKIFEKCKDIGQKTRQIKEEGAGPLQASPWNHWTCEEKSTWRTKFQCEAHQLKLNNVKSQITYRKESLKPTQDVGLKRRVKTITSTASRLKMNWVEDSKRVNLSLTFAEP